MHVYVAAELQMLMPGGLRVLGAYGQSRSSDAEALQAAADELVASVPAQLVGRRVPQFGVAGL